MPRLMTDRGWRPGMDSNHLPPPYAKTAHILCASPVMDLNEIPPTTGSGISIQLLQGHRAKEAKEKPV